MISLKHIAITSLALFGIATNPAHADSLFIAAHPDDIALMMHKNAESDVAGNYHVVFVLTTAGDAGNGINFGNNTMKVPYYRARLKAHEAYVHFWQGLNPDVAAPVPTHTTDVINGKNIEAVHMGNVTLYNLNLPDNNTLLSLATGKIASVNSISPVNTYTLAQLKATIREIIRINNPATPTVNLNTQDPDMSWDPGDHPDHNATGMIVSAAINESAQYKCVNLLLYRGYVIEQFPQTYTADEIMLHQATIGALNAELVANGNRSTWDDFHNNFVGRMDFRGIMGVGSCAF